MSNITEVILTTSCLDVPNREFQTDAEWTVSLAQIDKIQLWLREKKRGPLVQVNQSAGGTKVFTSGVWVGAFNYLDLKGFIALLASLNWVEPKSVQLFAKFDSQTGFLPMAINK